MATPWLFYAPLWRILQQTHTMMAEVMPLWEDPDSPLADDVQRARVDRFQTTLSTLRHQLLSDLQALESGVGFMQQTLAMRYAGSTMRGVYKTMEFLRPYRDKYPAADLDAIMDAIVNNTSSREYPL